jgi:hypothetical protein
MGKFASLEKDIFSVFGATEWLAENIATEPDNFFGKNTGNEYIRVIIIAGRPSVNCTSVSGQLSIDIFIPAGVGPNKASLIADKLDSYLVGKVISSATGNATQFGSSTLASNGIDSANPSLFRFIYSIPFNYFGV